MKTLPTKVKYSQKDYKNLKEEFQELNKEIENLTEFKICFKNLVKTLDEVSNLKVASGTDFTRQLEITFFQSSLSKPTINIRNRR